MRVIHLDSDLPNRLSPKDPAQHWRTQLLDAGLLIDPTHAQGPGATHLLTLRTALEALTHIEAQIDQLRHPIPWSVGGVPKAVWAFGLVTILAFTAQKNFAWAFFGTPFVFGGIGIYGLYIAWNQEKERQTDYQTALTERASIMNALQHELQSLHQTTGITWLPGAAIVASPHIDTLRRSLLTLPDGPERTRRTEQITAFDKLITRLRLAREPWEITPLELGEP